MRQFFSVPNYIPHECFLGSLPKHVWIDSYYFMDCFKKILWHTIISFVKRKIDAHSSFSPSSTIVTRFDSILYLICLFVTHHVFVACLNRLPEEEEGAAAAD